jgi:hypothetical protein
LPNAPAKTGEWFYEPKYNGWRALVHIPTGTMFNRKGKRLSVEKEFSAALDKLRAAWRSNLAFQWIDCEALERRHSIGRGTLIVLDAVPEQNTGLGSPVNRQAGCLPHVLNPCPPLIPGNEDYQSRRRWLELDIPLHTPLTGVPADNSLYLVQNWSQPVVEALEIWQNLKYLNHLAGCEFYEGVVAKRADSLYPIQLLNPERECAAWVKYRWRW